MKHSRIIWMNNQMQGAMSQPAYNVYLMEENESYASVGYIQLRGDSVFARIHARFTACQKRVKSKTLKQGTVQEALAWISESMTTPLDALIAPPDQVARSESLLGTRRRSLALPTRPYGGGDPVVIVAPLKDWALRLRLRRALASTRSGGRIADCVYAAYRKSSKAKLEQAIREALVERTRVSGLPGSVEASVSAALSVLQPGSTRKKNPSSRDDSANHPYFAIVMIGWDHGLTPKQYYTSYKSVTKDAKALRSRGIVQGVRIVGCNTRYEAVNALRILQSH